MKISNFLKKIFSLLLIMMVLFTQSLLFKTKASTINTLIVDGIDYSRNGTILNNEIRDGEAYVYNSEYVSIPTYSYGSYVYNDFDKLFAKWSSWSLSNEKYVKFKGYRYDLENVYIVDIDSREEHQYKRWNDKLNPVYRTKYITNYVKKVKFLFSYISTYSSEYSYNGFPGVKKGFIIDSFEIKKEIDYYNGGYEFYNSWSDKTPSSFPWENKWEPYIILE